jgi:3-phenylpropionate/cinnamic acid dioxygenase small subunit
VRHWIGNLVVAGDGAHATSRCYMLLFQQVEGSPTLRLSGSYADELRRIDGAWKIARRQITIDQGLEA